MIRWLRREPVLTGAIALELGNLMNLWAAGHLTQAAVRAAIVAVVGAATRCFTSPAKKAGW